MTAGVSSDLVDQRLGLAGAVPLREVGVVTLTGLAVFVLLALTTYSPFDSAWTYSSSHSEVRNMVGSSGAYAADILLYLLGRIAYVIPALLVLFGVRLLTRRGEGFVWERAALRLAGALVTLCCLATLLSLHWPAGDLPAGVGGVIGTAFADAGRCLNRWVERGWPVAGASLPYSSSGVIAGILFEMRVWPRLKSVNSNGSPIACLAAAGFHPRLAVLSVPK